MCKLCNVRMCIAGRVFCVASPRSALAQARILENLIQNVLARAARENFAKIYCRALWRAQRSKILPKYAPRPATARTTGNDRRRSHATGNLAASGPHNCGPIARHSRASFASHAVQSAWLMVPSACTVHSMAFHHSPRRMLASAQLHVCGAVVLALCIRRLGISHRALTC